MGHHAISRSGLLIAAFVSRDVASLTGTTPFNYGQEVMGGCTLDAHAKFACVSSGVKPGPPPPPPPTAPRPKGEHIGLLSAKHRLLCSSCRLSMSVS